MPMPKAMAAARMAAARTPRRVAGRRVRVFEAHEGGEWPRAALTEDGEPRLSTWMGGAALDGGGEDADRSGRIEQFDGYVDVEYGGAGAWLGMRVRLWTAADGSASFCSVRGVAWYEESRGRRLEPRVATVAVDEEQETTGDVRQGGVAVAERLPRVVVDVLARFRAANVQALNELESPRPKFEYELLQHHRELDVVVATVSGSGRLEVLFALPLLADEDPDVERDECGAMQGGSYLFGALPRPLVERDGSWTIVCLHLVSAPPDSKKTKTSVQDAHSWSVSLSSTSDLRLSSRVMQMSLVDSDGASSVDLLASCRHAFLSQWTRRRDFIGELRSKVIVLEFDPVDFSRVFFMLQEQLEPRAPLRVLVLALAFTPAFFVTRSLADLRVRLLDGRRPPPDGSDAGIAVDLSAHAPDAVEAWEHDTSALVAAFLSCLQSALIQHLYA